MAEKPIEFDKSNLLQMIDMNEFFSTLKQNIGETINIPECPNCGNLIQQLDLEVLAIVEGNFKVAKLIDKSYS